MRTLYDARAGFAVPAMLLVLLVVTGLLLDGAIRARAERQIAWNTAVDVRARAAARGGLAHVLLRLRALQGRTVSVDGSDPSFFNAWNRMDTVGTSLGRTALPGGAEYRVEVRDAAARLPLNAATAEELRRLFVSLGVEAEAASWAALSIVDRRERIGPFSDVSELRRLPGLETLPATAGEHLTVLGEGRVNLNTAGEPVLRALPGMTEESVGRVLTRREQGRFLRNLFELEAELSPPARRELQQNFAALARRASFEPVLLEIMSSGWVEHAPLRASVRAVGVRAGSTIQVVSSVEQ